MMDFLRESLAYYHWLVFGLGLLTVEVFVGGAFFLWLGLSAIAIGALVLVVPDISWQIQLLLFGVGVGFSLMIWRHYLTHTKVEDTILNHRGQAYIGKEYVLDSAIVGGSGILCIDDTRWQIRGPNAAEGVRVKVVSQDNMVLVVELVQ